jgi:hypothetical protein
MRELLCHQQESTVTMRVILRMRHTASGGSGMQVVYLDLRSPVLDEAIAGLAAEASQ